MVRAIDGWARSQLAEHGNPFVLFIPTFCRLADACLVELTWWPTLQGGTTAPAQDDA
jgi:hypothetical protein